MRALPRQARGGLPLQRARRTTRVRDVRQLPARERNVAEAKASNANRRRVLRGRKRRIRLRGGAHQGEAQGVVTLRRLRARARRRIGALPCDVRVPEWTSQRTERCNRNGVWRCRRVRHEKSNRSARQRRRP
eukprot:88743_1